jgi:PPE-repeat protein
MTASVRMALPAELHSALLSSRPARGGLLAASGSWSSLTAANAETAQPPRTWESD